MNFGCIIIEQVEKENLVIAIGDILKIILMNLIIMFVYKINKKILNLNIIKMLLETKNFSK